MFKDKFKIYLTPLLIVLTLSVVLFGCKANGSSAVSSSSSKVQATSSAVVSSPSSSNSTSSAPSSSSSNGGSVSSAPASSTPSKDTSGGKDSSDKKFVYLTIDATKGDEGIVANKVKVEFKSGDTAYTILKRYCDKKHIDYKAKNSSGSVYISMIDNLAEFNRGASSGWIYSINGKFDSQPCNKATVKPGDTVRWVYTIDLGKSEGATR
ncbi:DUF4430 domain-containing protein [[Clostridium] cellulosi]